MKTYRVAKKQMPEGTFPARAMVVYDAIVKLKTGTVEQVAKKLDYSGKQDPVKLAGFFLSQLSKQGYVTLVETEQPKGKTTFAEIRKQVTEALNIKPEPVAKKTTKKSAAKKR